ncbi:hypothetical protein L1787_07990 [Acuticoccus sp. M5D2P5]|uniref:hypothetical protein n=1 Tax=Acuticoccus TaxID=1904377 RepID=UPI00192E65CF|nr:MULTISPECIES: hypothetical protein [Acuticoccus]MCF3933348.1 hypothetical protein [Acuticoccus kalidii]
MKTHHAEAPSHIYAVGQSVRFRNRMDRPPHSPEDFRITRTLPPVGGLFQYSIRSEAEPYERVATEDRLELLPPSGGVRGSLSDRVFGGG